MLFQKCTGCGLMFDVYSISYLGPRDPKALKCNPFQDFVCYCLDCVRGTEYEEKKGVDHAKLLGEGPDNNAGE